MKCPGCNLEMDNEFDLCPRCLIDLRKYKRAIGLKVSLPNISYEALLQVMGVSIESQAPRESFFAYLKEISTVFFKKQKEAALPQKKEEAEKIKEPVSAPPAAAVAAAKPPQRAPIPVPAEPAPVITKPAPAVTKPAPVIKEKIEEPKKKEEVRHAPIPQPAPKPAPAKIEAKLPQKPQRKFKIPAADAFEINTLYVDASLDLPNYISETEITASSLVQNENRDEISILFDLAHESLIDPDFQARYVVPIVQVEKIHSKKLEAELTSFEAAYTASELALKMRGKITIHDRLALFTATARERLYSFTIDFIFVAITLLIMIISWRSRYDASIIFSLLEFQPIDANEIFLITGTFAVLLPIALTLYLFVTHVFLRWTIGELISQTRIVTAENKRPSFFHFLVRDGTTILTLFLGIIFFPLLLKETPSGVLSHTKPVRPEWEE
jgi:uncharacterized RDD family membrane protein YckC